MKPVPANPDHDPPRPSRTRGTVLLVEDELDNVKVAELQLRKRYEVLIATTDQEACEALRTSGTTIDAVLMDLQLRGSDLDGFQLARVMRGEVLDVELPAFARGLPASCGDIPILFVTAFAHSDEFDFDAVRASAVVGKPINFSELNLKLTQLYLARISSR
ncbi:MAG: response regulator [Nannocystales bacterium]